MADKIGGGKKWIKNVTREVTILPAIGVTKSFGKVSRAFDIPFDYKHILFVNNTWFYRETDYGTITKIFKERITQEPGYIPAVKKRQMKTGEALKIYITTLRGKSFSRGELAREILEYDQRMTEFYSFWWIAIPVGDILEQMVRLFLKNRKIDMAFDDLIFVRDELELVREKRLRSGIALKCKDYVNYKDLSVEMRKKLDHHAIQFDWINTSYHIGKSLTAQDFFERIKSENPEAALKEMEKQRECEKQILQKIVLFFTEEEQDIIEAMQTIIYMRNYQKETVNECQHKSEFFLEQVAKYLGVALQTVLAHSPEEIHDYLVKESTLRSIPKLKDTYEKRLGEFVIEYKSGKTIIIDSNEEVKKYQAIVKIASEDNSDNQINGLSACRGYVKGNVRVITRKKDIDLFKDGEVLVTVMTSIDNVHLMKRASAIVTDEGGITCHAAIFSREFGVPCIIGTKKATQILKDGDLVEVDADKGTVKIIKKANK